VKEQATETEAVAEPVATAAPAQATLPLTRYDQVLALQRTAGNRAVAQMLAHGSGAVLAREDTTTVEEFVRERTTGTDDVTWTARFDVRFDTAVETPTCWLTINVKLNPDGATDDDLQMCKMRVRSRFNLLWDSKFTLHEHRSILSDRDWLLRPEVQFVDKGQHLTVTLHKGKGADNRQNWYTESPEYTYAHEISHQMGLLDEYANDSVPDRKVYTDHSIMGDYYTEGTTEATAKLRHGERLASLIGADTDKNLTARLT
jgi:hypothetical protein